MVSFDKFIALADNDDEFLLQLLNQSLSDYVALNDQYHKLVKLRDTDKLSLIIHKIKSTMILFGLIELEATLKSHSAMLVNTTTDESIDEITVQISKSLNQVIAEIQFKIDEISTLQKMI